MHRLEIIPIRIQNVRCVVRLLTHLRANPGSTIILCTSSQRQLIKLIDCLRL